jgi:transcriptional regulator with XRE-family HTH domain
VADMPPLLRFGHALAAARVHCGLSQEQAARLIDVSLRQWARYETGRAAMPVDVFARVCRMLGCDAGAMLGTLATR